jgi:hypothetical protein
MVPKRIDKVGRGRMPAGSARFFGPFPDEAVCFEQLQGAVQRIGRREKSFARNIFVQVPALELRTVLASNPGENFLGLDDARVRVHHGINTPRMPLEVAYELRRTLDGLGVHIGLVVGGMHQVNDQRQPPAISFQLRPIAAQMVGEFGLVYLSGVGIGERLPCFAPAWRKAKEERPIVAIVIRVPLKKKQPLDAIRPCLRRVGRYFEPSLPHRRQLCGIGEEPAVKETVIRRGKAAARITTEEFDNVRLRPADDADERTIREHGRATVALAIARRKRVRPYLKEPLDRSCPFSAQRKASRAPGRPRRARFERFGELRVGASAVGDGDKFVENRLVGHFQLQLSQQLAETTFSHLSPTLDLRNDVGEREFL